MPQYDEDLQGRVSPLGNQHIPAGWVHGSYVAECWIRLALVVQPHKFIVHGHSARIGLSSITTMSSSASDCGVESARLACDLVSSRCPARTKAHAAYYNRARAVQGDDTLLGCWHRCSAERIWCCACPLLRSIRTGGFGCQSSVPRWTPYPTVDGCSPVSCETAGANTELCAPSSRLSRSGCSRAQSKGDATGIAIPVVFSVGGLLHSQSVARGDWRTRTRPGSGSALALRPPGPLGSCVYPSL
ncbi:hypothetical protein EDB84DRAFT_1434511 [Lactarius hengduanensis]|nr:hypothetical protein EDB84DRAFT_1434511 [Lactarius hengduanensis]